MSAPEPPDWAVKIPNAPIHPAPAPTGLNLEQPTAAEIATIRGKLLETILTQVLLALSGAYVPGAPGAAFTQLQAWAQPIASALATAITTGDFNPLLQALFGSTTIGSTIQAGAVPLLDASKIVSGLISLGVLPQNIPQSYISGLTSALNSFITTGNFFPLVQVLFGQNTVPPGATTINATAVPLLDASKITTGLVALGVLPQNIPQSYIDGLNAALSTFLTTGNMSPLYTSLYNFFTAGAATGLQQSDVTALLSDPLGAAKQWLQKILTPAGALTSSTPIPMNMLAPIVPGASANAMADPYFLIASALTGNGVFSHSATAPPGAPFGAGSAQVTADGMLLELSGMPIPIPLNSGAAYLAGISVTWSGVSASGQAFGIAVNSYTGYDLLTGQMTGLLPDPTRVVAVITNPAASGSWQAISGNYQPPTGTRFAVPVLTVFPGATAGQINFSAGVFDVPNHIDAGRLTNLPAIPPLPADNVALGGSTMPDVFQSLWDKIASALNLNPLTGQTLNSTAAAAQSVAQTTSNTAGLAATHDDILNNSQVNVGILAATIATFHLSDLPHDTTGGLPTTSIPAGGSAAGYVQATGITAQGLGFVSFLARAASAITGVYCNVYRVTASTGAWTRLWSSADIGSQISTGTNPAWVSVTISPKLTTVSPADWLALEVVSLNSALSIVAKQTNVPNLTGAIPPNMAAARGGVSAGTVSPASVAQSALAFSGTIPWIGAGVSGVNVIAYHAPEQLSYIGYGTATYHQPAWFRPGIDALDIVICGAAGGGCGPFNSTPAGSGGLTLVRNNRDASTVLAVAGSAPGTNPYSGGDGAAPPDYFYNGTIYHGGGGGFLYSAAPYRIIDGQAPGGGGSGAELWGVRAEPGHVGVWSATTFIPPTSDTLALFVGAGGIGGADPSTPGSAGGDGAIFITARQAS